MRGGLDFEGRWRTVPVAEALARTLDHIEQKGAHSLGTRVSCGYPDLDATTGGLPSGALTLITGAPGAGRTALALAMSRHIAANGSEEVLYVTGTDPVEALMMRLLSYEANVPVREISRGRLRQTSWNDLGSAVKLLSEMPLAFLEDPQGSIDSICAAAAMIEREGSLRSVFVDPVSSLRGWSGDPIARGSVLSRLRRMAAQHAVPVVVVAQSAECAWSEEVRETDLELFVSRETEPAVPTAVGSTVCITVRHPSCPPVSVQMLWDETQVRITHPVLVDSFRGQNGEGHQRDGAG